jgi:uncharacterized protein (DUF58 family)
MPKSNYRSSAAGSSDGVLSNPLLLRRRGRMLADAIPPLSPSGAIYSAFLRGNHGRRKAGSGDSFWQFRPYMPGDSASVIDWRRSARAESYFVRQYEWEAARDMWIACDLGPHMHFASNEAGRSKAEEAAVLAVSIGHLLARGGERVGLLGYSQRPIAGKYGTDLLAEKLIDAAQGPGIDLKDTMPPGRGTHTVWISDFLTPIERLRKRIKAVSRAGSHLHLVQILDPAEEHFPYQGRIEFEGPSRTNGHLVENAQDIRTRYLNRLSQHQDHITALAKEAGANILRHRTDRSLSPMLVSLSGLLEDI